jgi:hypothetical protein
LIRIEKLGLCFFGASMRKMAAVSLIQCHPEAEAEATQIRFIPGERLEPEVAERSSGLKLESSDVGMPKGGGI